MVLTIDYQVFQKNNKHFFQSKLSLFKFITFFKYITLTSSFLSIVESFLRRLSPYDKYCMIPSQLHSHHIAIINCFKTFRTLIFELLGYLKLKFMCEL